MNDIAAALRELGRLERTLFTLDWNEEPELRRGTTRALNEGEPRNGLARAVSSHRLGETRDRAIAALREVEGIPDDISKHLSPLGQEHVNLSGDYIWGHRIGRSSRAVLKLGDAR